MREGKNDVDDDDVVVVVVGKVETVQYDTAVG